MQNLPTLGGVSNLQPLGGSLRVDVVILRVRSVTFVRLAISFLCLHANHSNLLVLPHRNNNVHKNDFCALSKNRTITIIINCYSADFHSLICACSLCSTRGDYLSLHVLFLKDALARESSPSAPGKRWCLLIAAGLSIRAHNVSVEDAMGCRVT